jgi:hypothetical protein
MKKFIIRSIITLITIILGIALFIFFNEDARRSFNQTFDQSFKASFKTGFIKGCFTSSKKDIEKNTKQPITSSEIETLKRGCQCIITGGEIEGVFDKAPSEITNYFKENKNINYLLTKYECGK